jgi:hypothetical protein
VAGPTSTSQQDMDLNAKHVPLYMYMPLHTVHMHMRSAQSMCHPTAHVQHHAPRRRILCSLNWR